MTFDLNHNAIFGWSVCYIGYSLQDHFMIKAN